MAEPIVVGVDGSTPSLQAAGWAGREAELRGAPLRIVYVTLRWPYYVPLVPQPASWGADAEAAARTVLDQATVHARAGRPHLPVSAEIVDGAAPEALVAAAEGAQLIVVGNRGRGGFAELLLGSVSRYVTARAPCPVAVVRQTKEDGRGEITVGVTGHPDQEPVLEFAFREAALRHAGLRAVHAWTHPAATELDYLQPLVYDVDSVGAEEARLLAESIAGRRENFPDVTLTERVVREHPAKALIEASAETDLVVIGAHTGMATWLGLGATAHAVLHHARAPVIVVRH
ncbi:universal stress protein [Microbispora catharanthi]|uniref:Universal stress protein n=1 Tax=Microbispora catharanthi TaxID=1712871 RepID=A0A5N6B5P0_9ACTN|nr:universal stress protein [Microbispora catharanthi]KAB8176034.1 universal stress protein [Microbispora catharanthi]